jgi:indolepyruvate decarboxylase
MANVADYVARRLQQLGVEVLFGVPAFYCFRLFDAVLARNMKAVVTSSDLEAGYAADGYARTKGLGAVSVAYGVGTLSLANAVAGAFAERSPVVVLNGGPTNAQITALRDRAILYSHSIGREATDLTVFREVTEHAVRIGDVGQVPARVDAALTIAITKKRPVYIEIAQNLWTATCPAPVGTLTPTPPVAANEAALARRILELIDRASKPALLLGLELQRYGLADTVEQLIRKLPAKCPWATTVVGKSIVAEDVPGFIGVCDRQAGSAYRRLEQADQLIALGCVFATGYRTLVNQSFGHMVHAVNDQVRIGNSPPVAANLGLLVTELNRQAMFAAERAAGDTDEAYAVAQGDPRHAAAVALTHAQLFREVERLIDGTWLVVADTFLGIHAASDLKVKGRNAFLCNAVWASIGHSIGAAAGAALAGGRRPIVVCGDGGFQMIAQALSTMAAHDLNPVVIVVVNRLYGYEQYLIDRRFFDNPQVQPKPYASLNSWNYTALARAMGLTSVFDVATPAELSTALAAAKAFRGPSFIAAALEPRDLPPQL